ncbi:MAG TPA: hypothetical protein VI233_17780 [Puia sp.]
MKYALFFLVCLFLAGRSHAQVKSKYPTEKTILRVLLTKNGMTVTYLDKILPIKDVKGIDSLVATIPDSTNSRIEYESRNADPDLSLAIIRALEKSSCHLTTKSIKMQD